jgi:hypothetical protein
LATDTQDLLDIDGSEPAVEPADAEQIAERIRTDELRGHNAKRNTSSKKPVYI